MLQSVPYISHLAVNLRTRTGEEIINVQKAKKSSNLILVEKCTCELKLVKNNYRCRQCRKEFLQHSHLTVYV